MIPLGIGEIRLHWDVYHMLRPTLEEAVVVVWMKAIAQQKPLYFGLQ